MRTLVVPFQTLPGSTPHDEIFRGQINRVKELLAVVAVAERAGFKHME